MTWSHCQNTLEGYNALGNNTVYPVQVDIVTIKSYGKVHIKGDAGTQKYT